MKNTFPIEIACLYAIVVKEGDKNAIAEILKIKSIEFNTWAYARKKQSKQEKFDKIGHHELVIISDTILGWNYVICNNFYDLKYTLNCCNALVKSYDKLFTFMIDVHSGDYRFIKFQESKLVRFFERDSEANTGEFGEELEEEIAIINTTKEEDYFHALSVAEVILRREEWVDSLFLNPVLFGKRYTMDIEKYKGIFF